MNLIIDKGNTFCKIAIFNHQIKQPDYVINVENSKLTVALIKEVLVSFPQTNSVIVSSVSGLPWEFTEFFQQNFSIYIETNWQTPVPIINKYTTPQTLGFDRLAAAVGGTVLFPNRNLIVFDAGTALTVEVVNANHEYLGGNISPGLSLRYKALNLFTSKLPEISPETDYIEIGISTESAIRAGVQQGLKFEILGYTTYFNNIYYNPAYIITGGDCFFFDKIFKSTIFAEPNLVLIGLNRILLYNVQKN